MFSCSLYKSTRVESNIISRLIINVGDLVSFRKITRLFGYRLQLAMPCVRWSRVDLWRPKQTPHSMTTSGAISAFSSTERVLLIAPKSGSFPLSVLLSTTNL